MKSSIKQIENRGFVSDDVSGKYKKISGEEIIKFLNSPIPCDRTLGARLSILRKSDRILRLLCKILINEKKLYTKIALSEAIEQYGVSAIKNLIPLLGKIGNSQHRKIALVDINKNTYPLPRDIAARIIIRIGEPALPFLEEILQAGSYDQKLEAIDAIGHIAFNFNQYRSEKYLHKLLKENSDDELIVWKIIRAFQSFISREVEDQLKKIIDENMNVIFVEEAKRSLRQIEKRILH